MTDKALIELGYRYGAEVRELAQGALDALKPEDVEACRKALLELLASVDRYHRALFASGPLQEGNAHAEALESEEERQAYRQGVQSRKQGREG